MRAGGLGADHVFCREPANTREGDEFSGIGGIGLAGRRCHRGHGARRFCGRCAGEVAQNVAARDASIVSGAGQCGGVQRVLCNQAPHGR
jgi:hypothetical protein